MMAPFDREIEIEEQLKEAGKVLLTPPSTIDDLLKLLDRVEHLLANVEQAPSRSMQNALLPSMKALASTDLLRHLNMDVRISVVSCISEITRITAPDAPYNDEQMKEIFHLTVAAFENLSHASSCCYKKAISILDTVAKVRSCLVMLDLECDALIIQMFQCFLKIIGSNHPHTVFLAMETIMTLVLDESEDVSFDLLHPLLASVRKENKISLPMSWKLGEKVLSNCFHKLKPYLMEMVQSTGINLDEYSPLVASICKSESTKLEHHSVIESGEILGSKRLLADAVCRGEVYQAVDENSKQVAGNGTDPSRNNEISRNDNCSKRLDHSSVTEHFRNIDTSGRAGSDNLVSAKAAKLEADPETLLKKRGRKPNSLMNPEEGYDHSWICTSNKNPKIRHGKKNHEKGVDISPSTTLVLKMAPPSSAGEGVTRPPRVSSKTNASKGFSSPSVGSSLPGEDHSTRRQTKKKSSKMDQDDGPKILSVSKSKVLSALVENKAPQHADVTVKIEPKDRSKLVTKKGKNSKLGHAVKDAEQTTQAPDSVCAEKGPKASVGTKEVELHRTVVKVEASEDRDSGDTTANKVIAEASMKKKLISKSSGKKSGKKESYLDETPKRNLKRKLTTSTEMESKGFHRGEELVGRKIKVWWPLDKMFYEGVVDSYDHIKKKHKVLYSDGDEELLNLKKEDWQLIENNDFPEGETETNRQMLDNSSDLLQKMKGKKKDGESAKRGKADLLASRSGAGSSSSKIRARKRGVKTVDVMTQDKSIVNDKPMKAAPAKASKGDSLKSKSVKVESEIKAETGRGLSDDK